MTNTVNTASVSPGTLVILFADRFAPKSEGFGAKLMGEHEAPNGTKVKITELAITQCVAAFFGLRETGLITLAYQQKKLLGLIPTKSVIVALTKQEPCGGIDGVILHKIAAAKKEYTAKRAVVDAFGGEHNFPALGCVLTAQGEAVDKGFLSLPDDQRNMLEKMFKSGPKPTPVLDKISTLDGTANDFQQRFQAFQTAEPELYNQLVAEVKSAFSDLRAASQSDNTSGNDF